MPSWLYDTVIPVIPTCWCMSGFAPLARFDAVLLSFVRKGFLTRLLMVVMLVAAGAAAWGLSPASKRAALVDAPAPVPVPVPPPVPAPDGSGGGGQRAAAPGATLAGPAGLPDLVTG